MFSTEVFETIAQRLQDRSQEISLFLEASTSFEEWCIWEAYAACRAAKWTVQPKPSYATVGLMGSRESADLLITDPRSGSQSLLEFAVVHDWTTNRWIAALDQDTINLSRALTTGTELLQMILAASLASPIEINRRWKTWLEMTSIWPRPSALQRTIAMGPSGEGILRGWILQKK